MTGGTPSAIFSTMTLTPAISCAGNKKIWFVPYQPNQYLDELASMVASGQIKPVIDRTVPLHQVPEVFRYFGQNTLRGKIATTF